MNFNASNTEIKSNSDLPLYMMSEKLQKFVKL